MARLSNWTFDTVISFAIILVFDHIVKNKFGLGYPDSVLVEPGIDNGDKIHFGNVTGEVQVASTYFSFVVVGNLSALVILAKWISAAVHFGAALGCIFLLCQEPQMQRQLIRRNLSFLPLLLVYNLLTPIPSPIPIGISSFTLFLGSLAIRVFLGCISFVLQMELIHLPDRCDFKEIPFGIIVFKIFLFSILFIFHGIFPFSRELFLIISAVAMEVKVTEITLTLWKTFYNGFNLYRQADWNSLTTWIMVISSVIGRGLNIAQLYFCFFWLTRTVWDGFHLCNCHFRNMQIYTGYQCMLLQGTTTLLDIVGVAYALAVVIELCWAAVHVFIKWEELPDEENRALSRNAALSCANLIVQISFKMQLTSLPDQDRVCALLLNILFVAAVALGPVHRIISKTLTSFVQFQNEELRAIFGSCLLLLISTTGLYYVRPTLPDIVSTCQNIIIFTLSFSVNILGCCGIFIAVTLVLRSWIKVQTHCKAHARLYCGILIFSFGLSFLYWSLFLTAASYTLVVLSVLPIAVCLRQRNTVRRLLRSYPLQSILVTTFYLITPGIFYLTSSQELVFKSTLNLTVMTLSFVLQETVTLIIYGFTRYNLLAPTSSIFQYVSIESITTALHLLSVIGDVGKQMLVLFSGMVFGSGWLFPTITPFMFDFAFDNMSVEKALRNFGQQFSTSTKIQAARSRAEVFPDATSDEIASRADDVCPICLVEMQTAKMNHCGHVFHRYCMQQLFMSSIERCPLCNAELRLKYTDQDWHYDYFMLKWSEPIGDFGVNLTSSTFKTHDGGAHPVNIVQSVTEEVKAATNERLKPGDIVERVNGTYVLDQPLENVNSLLKKKSDFALLYIKRRGPGTVGPKTVDFEFKLENNRKLGFALFRDEDEDLISIANVKESGVAFGFLEAGDLLVACGKSATCLEGLYGIPVKHAVQIIAAAAAGSNHVHFVVIKVVKEDSWMDQLLS